MTLNIKDPGQNLRSSCRPARVLPQSISEIESYRKEIPKLKTVKRRVLFCVEHWPISGFRLTDAYPDARDAFDMADPTVKQRYEGTDFVLCRTTERSSGGIPLKLSAEQVARLLIFSLRGIKDIATDAESMPALLVQEVDLFLAALSVHEVRYLINMLLLFE